LRDTPPDKAAFRTLAHALALIAGWPDGHKRSAPKTSLGGRSPAPMAALSDEDQNQNTLSF